MRRAVLVLAIATPAAADDLARAVLDKIDRLAADLRYDEARRTCDEALAAGGFALADMREIGWRCAVVEATLGDKMRIDARCRSALALDPARAPPAAPPRVREAFERAQKWWSEREPFALRHVPPVRMAGEPPSIRVAVGSDPLGLARAARVAWRPAGGDWRETPAAPFERGSVAMLLPADAAQYFVVALDANGSVVAAVGSAEAPLRIEQPAPPPPPRPQEPDTSLWREWWFWAGAGTFAVVLGVVLIQASDP